jgi:hypothetical protein
MATFDLLAQPQSSMPYVHIGLVTVSENFSVLFDVQTEHFIGLEADLLSLHSQYRSNTQF